MQNKAGAILVLLFHGAFLLFFFNTHTVPHYKHWETGLKTDGIISSFSFGKGMQGKLTVNYRVQGQDLQGTVKGFFIDYQKDQPIELIIDQDDPNKIAWSSFIRFWFLDLVIIGFWGGMLLIFSTHFFSAYTLFKHQSWGILLASIGLVGGVLVYQHYKSIDAFLAVSDKVMATVSDIAVETCTRKSGDDDVSYTCYRPTYTYSYGRRVYTKLSENTYKERPPKGQLQALQVWKDQPATAKKASTLPKWGYQLLIAVFAFFLAWGVWLFFSFSIGISK